MTRRLLKTGLRLRRAQNDRSEAADTYANAGPTKKYAKRVMSRARRQLDKATEDNEMTRWVRFTRNSRTWHPQVERIIQHMEQEKGEKILGTVDRSLVPRIEELLAEGMVHDDIITTLAHEGAHRHTAIRTVIYAQRSSVVGPLSEVKMTEKKTAAEDAIEFIRDKWSTYVPARYMSTLNLLRRRSRIYAS